MTKKQINSELAKSARFESIKTAPGNLSSTVSRGANRVFEFSSTEYSASSFPIRLYRFMAANIPIIKSVIWTWSRLAAAPGEFEFNSGNENVTDGAAMTVIKRLFDRINYQNFGHGGQAEDLLQPIFQSLFLDGAVAGRIILEQDLSGIAGFEFFDLAQVDINFDSRRQVKVVFHDSDRPKQFGGPDLFYYPFDANLNNPFGQSILKAVPFITRIEQQLIDDMQRTAHNAGYHRLHVKITPPEKREGEGDDNYIKRANEYFDQTLATIRQIEPQDNPVTWNDVNIEYIGPRNTGGPKSNQWYLHHRAMVEEICSGTHLAPFLLGYSYNATTNWAQLKYDLIMRQISTVQNSAVALLNRLAGIELALRGFQITPGWVFDNSMSALAADIADVKNKNSARVIDMFQNGLIDRDTAAQEIKRYL